MPWYYLANEEESELVNVIQEAVDYFEEETGVEVSPYSTALIVNTIVAIDDDPHPGWEPREDARREQQQALLDELPRYLNQMVELRRRRERPLDRPLTYFEVLHWLGMNLDAACPFPKER